MPQHTPKERKKRKGEKKVGKVLGEFKKKTLKSGSGKKVTNRKQAIAIALSEARKAGANIPKKKESGLKKRSTSRVKRIKKIIKSGRRDLKKTVRGSKK